MWVFAVMSGKTKVGELIANLLMLLKVRPGMDLEAEDARKEAEDDKSIKDLLAQRAELSKQFREVEERMAFNNYEFARTRLEQFCNDSISRMDSMKSTTVNVGKSSTTPVVQTALDSIRNIADDQIRKLQALQQEVQSLKAS